MRASTMIDLKNGRAPVRNACLTATLVISFALVHAANAGAQWVTTYDQFYLQAPHNWAFRNQYQAADRLFNAFDFGHAILYETLWDKPNAPASELEQKWYDRLTKQILVRPPRVPLEEGAIEIAYARLAPEAKQMFDWAHVLHRQVYDVWADEAIPLERKDAEVQHLIAYYKSRRDIAFSSKPKSMALMQEQPYSIAFRKDYPKFNGLIWAYHWLQVGLYEPLVVGKSAEERQAGVRATVARFWQMLENPTSTMPYIMPMTAGVAPEFSKRYPEAAIIFDNLHSMHDVVSDILANDNVPRSRKRAELMRAARLFRDDTSFVMTEPAWRTMAQHMGVENMGGPAQNFLPALPEKTVTYGAVMTHDERTGEMTGFKYGQATGGEHAGMQHGATPRADSAKSPMDHSKMNMPATRDSSRAQPDTVAHDHAKMNMADSTSRMSPQTEQMMELHMRMMADPVIRKRVMADTAMRRMMTEVVNQLPAEHREHLESMMRQAPAPQPALQRAPTRAKKQTPAKKPADPHAGHETPAPTAAPKKPPVKKDSLPGMDHSKMPGMKKP
jgi:hypothetical protein